MKQFYTVFVGMVILLIVPTAYIFGTKSVEADIDVSSIDKSKQEILVDRAYIYLINLNTTNQNGTVNGCSESVTPVPIQIEPTTVPLETALENLFAINQPTDSQSDLYNALYRSKLVLENIYIDHKGRAQIDLSGRLSFDKVCDATWLAAQLWQTALQFDTVTSVTINFNGRLLVEELSRHLS